MIVSHAGSLQRVLRKNIQKLAYTFCFIMQDLGALCILGIAVPSTESLSNPMKNQWILDSTWTR